MDFGKVIAAVVAGLDAAEIRYAAIGGFAMALRGVQRATMDLDFILLLEDLERADGLLTDLGYRRAFRSENVTHYVSPDGDWGRIDILHAFRRPSLGMLNRAERMVVIPGVRLPVVQIEDLIGLKIQALTNDPDRAEGDWHDIRSLLKAARTNGAAIDWELIVDYLGIFHLEARLAELKRCYGETD